MIVRYQDLKVKQIWGSEKRLQIWTWIEVLVAKYWNQVGLISDQDLEAIVQVKPDSKQLQLIEQKNNHEMSAFVEMLANQAGTGGKWIHYGLTSNDVLDTAQNYCLKASALLIQEQLNKVLSVLKTKAHQEKKTICLGRTHGVVAEPITLGYKFALWFHELQYHYQHLPLVTEGINYTKILGPTGISAHFPLDLNQFVAKHLDMKAVVVGSQLFGRYHYITFFNALTNLVVSLEKIATEIRNLHRSEINEVKEGFAPHQKGSSSMPHKKNPILCENICGLARMLRSLNNNFHYTNLLWHERDLTNSAIERVVIPDFFHLLTTMLNRLVTVLTNLEINHQQIAKNLSNFQAEIFSHKVLLTLLKHSKLNRNQAYEIVQKSSFWVQTQKQSFSQSLIKHGVLNYLTAAQLKNCLNIEQFFSNLDHLFTHIFSNSQ